MKVLGAGDKENFMDPTMKDIIDSIPQSVKDAVSSFNSTKLAEASTGITDFTIENVARHFGMKLASRRQRWQPVADGILALQKLRSE